MCDKLTHKDEVAEVDSLVELYVQAFLRSRDEEVGVELLADLLDELDTLLKTLLCTTIPTCSHIMWPSSLWIESTERLPLMFMRRSISA